MGKVTRQANFEALRILAMVMVVTMHYLMKGNVAVSLATDGSAVNEATWLLEAFCIVAVNVYVLISGYFLVESQWKISRLIKLIFQIWFYSLGVPVVCMLLGIGDIANWDKYQWATALLPLQMEHYWFATAYVVMYLLTPVLSAGVKKMTQKQLQSAILLLLVFFSLGKSLLPILIPTDHYGYDFGWFICLFLIAAYIRIYGIPYFEKKNMAVTMYIIVTIAIWTLSSGLGWLSRKGLPLSYAMDMMYCYNHILVLLSSVSLFYAFGKITIKKNWLTSLINKVAPYTFGVYLLHENVAIRNLWQTWFSVENVLGSWKFIPHMIGTVFAVFLAGVMVDFVREKIFMLITKTYNNVFAKKLS